MGPYINPDPDLGWWVYHSLSPIISKKWELIDPIAHIIHGIGRFTSPSLPYINYPCRKIYQSHGLFGNCLFGWLVGCLVGWFLWWKQLNSIHSSLPGIFSETHLGVCNDKLPKIIPQLQEQAILKPAGPPGWTWLICPSIGKTCPYLRRNICKKKNVGCEMAPSFQKLFQVFPIGKSALGKWHII